MVCSLWVAKLTEEWINWEPKLLTRIWACPRVNNHKEKMLVKMKKPSIWKMESMKIRRKIFLSHNLPPNHLSTINLTKHYRLLKNRTKMDKFLTLLQNPANKKKILTMKMPSWLPFWRSTSTTLTGKKLRSFSDMTLPSPPAKNSMKSWEIRKVCFFCLSENKGSSLVPSIARPIRALPKGTKEIPTASSSSRINSSRASSLTLWLILNATSKFLSHKSCLFAKETPPTTEMVFAHSRETLTTWFTSCPVGHSKTQLKSERLPTTACWKWGSSMCCRSPDTVIVDFRDSIYLLRLIVMNKTGTVRKSVNYLKKY